MPQVHPSGRTRRRLAILAAVVALPVATIRAQAPAAPELHQVSTFGVGATSLSSTGSSSVGASVYYMSAVNHFGFDFQASMFSQSGVTTYGSQVAGGYAWGPFLNPSAAEENWRTAMFFVGGGMWGSFSDGGSSTDPMLLFTGAAPIGPATVKLGYGFVLAKASNISVMNIGVGFKFGVK